MEIMKLCFEGKRREQKLISIMKMIRTKFPMEYNQIEQQLLNTSNYTKNEDGNEERCDEMIARCEEEIRLLEEFLRELDSREEVTTTKVPDSKRVSLTVLEAGRDLQTNSLFADIEDNIDECDVVIRAFEQRLYKSEVQKPQEPKDVRVVVRIQQFQSNQQQQSEQEDKNYEILIQGEVQSQMLDKAIEEVG